MAVHCEAFPTIGELRRSARSSLERGGKEDACGCGVISKEREGEGLQKGEELGMSLSGDEGGRGETVA